MRKNLFVLVIAMFMPLLAWTYDEFAPRGYAVFDEETGTLTFMYGDLESRPKEGSHSLGYETDYYWRSQWLSINPQIKKVVFTPAFANAHVESTQDWFLGAESLTEVIGLEYLNTNTITSMNSMFCGCSSLESLDVRNFNTANVQDMSNMFARCSSLTSLDVSHFDTSSTIYMDGMFEDCSGLEALDVSHFDTGNVEKMGWLFYNCSGLSNLDISHFATQNVTSMAYMFYGCSGLRSLDVSSFNTTKVTDMKSMFRECCNLVSLDISHFNTANVKDMSNMFAKCSSLTSLDVSHFDTGNVEKMEWLFYNCSGLTNLDTSHFTTTNVTNMAYMFSGCSGLSSLDISSFNTTKVTNMSSTFKWCSNLVSLDVSHFNTANVKDMSNMFAECSSLTSLDVSQFDTSNLTDMSWMFYNCKALTTINLKSFDTYEVLYMQDLFTNCISLTTIYASEKWNTSNVIKGEDVFYNCSKIVGGKGTKYDVSHSDYTYARIDEGSKKPGYFTGNTNRSGGIIVSIIKEDGERLNTEVTIEIINEEEKKVVITSAVIPASESETTEVAIPAEVTYNGITYMVTSIANDAFAGKTEITDIYLPLTDEPIGIGTNALKIDDENIATIHSPIALLDDYAENAQLKQNVEAGKLMATVKVPNKYWTFSCGINVEIPNKIKVYTCKIANSTEVEITEIAEECLALDGKRILKAYNGVLIACPDDDDINTYDIVAQPDNQTNIANDKDAKSYGLNMLEPVIVNTHYSAEEYYVLKNNEFHAIDSTKDTKVPACKAVLRKPANVATTRTLSIVEDNTTEISHITFEENDTKWYNLNGQRISKPTAKGIYIKNGKKVIRK